MTLRLEFTVESFAEDEPGPHVLAAVEAARGFGLDVDFGPFGPFGPFGRVDDGDDAPVLDAVDAVVRAAMGAGATRVPFQLTRR